MVDVAAIFDVVFGPDDQAKGLSEKRCAPCARVPQEGKPLEINVTPGTPSNDCGHTANQGVPEAGVGCARDIVENQGVTSEGTRAHRAHPKTDNPLQPIDINAYEEHAAIILEAHTTTIDDDGALLPEPIFALTQEHAETLAAQEQGYDDADSLHSELVRRWAVEIDRLVKLRAVGLDGAEALKRAQAFIGEGWALQANRLGWDEVELFGVCPRASWRRLDRKGVAFGGAVVAVTAEAVAYVGGLRRFKAQVNNDGGAVPIWELTGVES